MFLMFSVAIFFIIVYVIIDWLLHSSTIGSTRDKHVLVTGCDTGFGRHLVMRLDKLGFHVFAGCLTSEGARSLSETCSSKVTTVDLDVTKTESIEAALNVVKKSLPEDTGLWALVNNAGILGRFTKSELCTKEDFEKVIHVNLLGLVDVTNHSLPLIRKARGRIVNVSSVSGRLGYILAPYTASKFGVEGYSDVLRKELLSQGIKVSIIEPGGFRTPFLENNNVADGVRECYARASPEVRQLYCQNHMQKCNRLLAGSHIALSPNIDLVTDAYIHAITARLPRNRYIVGLDAKLFFIPLSFLPSWIVDWFFHTVLHMCGLDI